ncbi:MAG: bifunctional demethylmenaquinone methyltransferase/2-methoxy-6-polyprenyl-1,4-benzoquinol methylase UbiE [Desulfosalsimonadaceae bacterium]
MKGFRMPGWFGHGDRVKMLDDHIERSGRTYFGLRELGREEKQKAVLEHFNRVAPRYDFMNSLLSFGIHYAWKRKAVRLLDVRPDSCVLDVCGGTGDLAVFAARRLGPAGNVFLYDRNHSMMEAGRSRPENRLYEERIHCVQGDAERLSFAADCFDAAMVGFGIRNLTHLKQGLQEMYRVLKPGGSLMCLEFSKPVNPLFRALYDGYSFYIMPLLGKFLAGSGRSYSCLSESIRMFATAEELKAILESTGFASVSYTRLTNGIAAIHCGRKPPAS